MSCNQIKVHGCQYILMAPVTRITLEFLKKSLQKRLKKRKKNETDHNLLL